MSLSILYVAIARRLGWQADVLNTPSHVLVRVGPEDSTALIDPFNGGALVEADDYAALLDRAVGPGGGMRAYDIAPMSNRITLVRLLLNQAMRAEQAGDTVHASILYERMTIIAPDHGAGWWELARLHLIHGKVGGARTSLSAMLEITRESERRAQISAMLDRLSRSE